MPFLKRNIRENYYKLYYSCTPRTYGLSYGEGHMGLAMGHKTMVGFIVVIEFHIHSCICALFVVDLRCSAKKMKVLTS